MTSDSERLPANLGVDARVILGAFPGPALLFSAAGHVVAANSAGSNAADLLAQAGDEVMLAGVLNAARDGTVRSASLLVQDDAVEFLLVPLNRDGGGTSHVLALGKHAELEQSLMTALVASRQMFKDLVECSSDFSWETKTDRTFSYVSSRGALGYAASELVGMDVQDLIAGDDADLVAPFWG